MSDGTHSFAAIPTNWFCIPSPASASLTLTIDKIAPSAPTIESLSSASGTSVNGTTDTAVPTLERNRRSE